MYFKFRSLLVLLYNPSICLDFLRVKLFCSATPTVAHLVVRLVHVLQTINAFIDRGVVQAHPRIVFIEACVIIFILATTFIETALFQSGIG